MIYSPGLILYLPVPIRSHRRTYTLIFSPLSLSLSLSLSLCVCVCVCVCLAHRHAHMDSPEFSDRGLNPMTPEHGAHNGKVVHYYGHGGEGGSTSRGGRLHPKADAALLFLRLLTLAFSLASLVLMATNTATVRGHTVKWVDFDAYRYVLAASGIVCLYSFAEIGLGLWYLCKGWMLMPDSMAHWFDFGHDQGFAYLIFSACSAGTVVAHNLRERHILIHRTYGCDAADYFCMKAEISIGLAFGAFLFIALSALLSGFRLARWLILGP